MANALQIGVATAGGIIVNNNGVTTNVAIGTAAPVILGAKIASHGAAPHAASTMVQASSDVFVAGIPMCKEGNLASCAHASTNGFAKVQVN